MESTTRRLGAICVLTLLGMAGCHREAPAPVPIMEPAMTAAPPIGSKTPDLTPLKPVYSPFAVRIEGGFWIGTISFKDVGLGLGDPALRAQVHEALAEAVAARLSDRHDARMQFDPTVADPLWHTSCAGQHLYVDVWQASHPDRLGYSLWSGCGADDRLAWEELPLTEGPVTGSNLVPAAVRLADRVVAQIDPCPATVCG
jgi:hypothetical protein